MRLSQNDIIGLAILEKLEALRQRFESRETYVSDRVSADWVVRVCEAEVANYTQFKNRASWVEALKKETVK